MRAEQCQRCAVYFGITQHADVERPHGETVLNLCNSCAHLLDDGVWGLWAEDEWGSLFMMTTAA